MFTKVIIIECKLLIISSIGFIITWVRKQANKLLINNDTYAHIMDKKILWINLKFLSFRPSSRHNNIVNCNNTLFFCSSFFHFISFKLGCFRIDLDGLYQLGLYRVLAVLRKKNNTIDAWFGKKDYWFLFNNWSFWDQNCHDPNPEYMIGNTGLVL